MRRDLLKYVLTAGVISGAILAIILIASRNDKEPSDQKMGPEEVVKAFNMAITSGDFDTAYTLCDTVRMRDYLNSYQEAWNILQQEDSSILSIASALLSDGVLQIDKTEKNAEARYVHYTLEADGHSKARTAKVEKEEGEWKVTEITDRPQEETEKN
uniref:Uncharacterized protein n=1 Tax=feces metagenome TaxID=1861841 RepID=A0A2I2K940_9ZZZZ